VQLTHAHWSGWGSASAVAEAQALNNQPGMGGPASYTIHVTLFDIRRGCHGNLFYTQARVSSRYGTGSLLLTATCKAIFNHGQKPAARAARSSKRRRVWLLVCWGCARYARILSDRRRCRAVCSALRARPATGQGPW